jgi:hypothetical protein
LMIEYGHDGYKKSSFDADSQKPWWQNAPKKDTDQSVMRNWPFTYGWVNFDSK